MAKEVNFARNPRSKPAPEDLDAFVHGGAARPTAEPLATVPVPASVVPKVPMKRLTFDIPANLHMRMKLDCVGRGKDMADELREMIDKRWPAP
jgi:hypothetical protein